MSYEDPRAINDSGVVAVNATSPSSGVIRHAFLWNAGASMTVPAPTGNGALVYHVNNTGSAVGIITNPSDVDHISGFIYDISTGQSFTPTVSGVPVRYVTAINDHARAVGAFRDNVSGYLRAFEWEAGATILPALGTGDAYPRAINNAGQVVGSSGNSFFDSYPFDPTSPLGPTHAVMWQGDTLVDLTPDHAWSEAFDINNHGRVVGSYMRADPIRGADGPTFTTPFWWTFSDGMTSLPSFDGHAQAVAINEAGAIVGHAYTTPSGVPHAALWIDGTLNDLNALIDPASGWVLQRATDINDDGVIIGTGFHDGRHAAFLLTPIGLPTIPEPGAGLLYAAAAALLASPRRPRSV